MRMRKKRIRKRTRSRRKKRIRKRKRKREMRKRRKKGGGAPSMDFGRWRKSPDRLTGVAECGRGRRRRGGRVPRMGVCSPDRGHKARH